MGTLSARNLRESLQKARNIGIVEERFPLFEDCELVVRNLRPDEYESITSDTKELEGIDYLYAFQYAHVNRAIVEINGQDLRDVQFVDDEEEDPKHPGTMKPVKLELRHWLFKNVVSTWSKEALYVVYRKVEDAVEQAEKRARDGITFITPDETDEDRFRRIVGEMKDLEDNLPSKLVEHILDQSGYMRKSTAEETKRAMERVDQLAREEEAKKKAGTPPQTPPAAASPPLTPQAPPAPPAPIAAAPIVTPPPAGPSPQELMAARQPMNFAAVDAPQPVIVSPTPRQNTVPGGRPPPGAPPSEHVHPPLQGAILGPQPHGSAAVRGLRHAALESEADQAGAISSAGPTMPVKPTNVPVLERKQAPIDPRGAMSVIDAKPKGGLNPHYRPQR
jgi:hypothetical protein